MRHRIIPRTELYISDEAVFVEWNDQDARYSAAFIRDSERIAFVFLYSIGVTKEEIEDATIDDLPSAVISVLQSQGWEVYGRDATTGWESERGEAT